MSDKVISVLTFKSVDTILALGGTQSWVLDRNRAKACKYVVICRNAYHPDVEGTEEHGHGFMVGKIKDVVPSTETKDRWLILVSEYAVGDFGPQWEGRNPVAYFSTDDYVPSEGYGGLDFDALVFKPMPEPVQAEDGPSAKAGLTIAEAKAGLAVTFAVDPSAIEITIRG
ncbi:hypothetical protein [Methylobacterium sp. GC_Met_2]|uniref:hypothetical protein n=1 Tax=Methylobacterium sp. GC_Met_2 TaxID=2937376 RepID=UPI00226B35A7|nr:hypothetical protein [Methylobacterium sp. GC_Met_2]